MASSRAGIRSSSPIAAASSASDPDHEIAQPFAGGGRFGCVVRDPGFGGELAAVVENAVLGVKTPLTVEDAMIVAKRGGDVGAGESNALLSQAIEVRC